MKAVCYISVFVFCIGMACTGKKGADRSPERISGPAADPLPSWNSGAVKKAIIAFVRNTSTWDEPGFVPPEERIACFDNDGTLWGEQPMYVQLAYALDEVRNQEARHPEWKIQEPFKSVLEGKMPADEADVLQLITATHANIPVDEFQANVRRWIKTARHPETGLLYRQMVFQPMLELIAYLKTNKYQVFIVSGGGVDFMRVWAWEVYGIPGHHIIGSSGKIQYKVSQGEKPELLKLPGIAFLDDKEAKPVAIWQHIGKRPLFSFGNSDGDYAMLLWTTAGTKYPHFGGIVHHTDAEREFAYDRKAHFGRLSKGIDHAGRNGWLVTDMKRDWKVIYPL